MCIFVKQVILERNNIVEISCSRNILKLYVFEFDSLVCVIITDRNLQFGSTIAFQTSQNGYILYKTQLNQPHPPPLFVS